jgi:iron complex outermembrane receptor protein
MSFSPARADSASHVLRITGAAALGLLWQLASAQGVGSAANPAPMEQIVVTGNPLGSTDVVPTVNTLAGEKLLQRRGSTLGETLQGLPGVANTGFGPNSGRPVIRGLDGDRIRILNNSSATVDASSLSNDHAVAMDPLAVERIEVLRGPAALLYGGAAIGGVVNLIDNRIPRESVSATSGAAELRAGGAAREKSASAMVESGNGRIAVHADAFKRDTDDLRTPRFSPVGAPGSEPGEPTRRVRNSASEAKGAALGSSLTFDDGSYVGAAFDHYGNDYGVVVDEAVQIRMKRDRYALAGEWKAPVGAFSTVRANLGHTRYEHEELEDGAVGTLFENRGTDWRIEAEHRPLGAWRGVLGIQGERVDASALGDEAFVPETSTHSDALFLVEELALSAGKLTAGARVEHTRVNSAGGGTDGRFGDPTERSFTLGSASLGGLWRLGGPWQLSASASHSERAPTYYELYANGEHVATAAFERGDVNQRKERGQHLELGLQWKHNAHSVKLSPYYGRFSNYITLRSTGEVEGELPVYAFEGVKARLYGFELEARTRLLDGAHRVELDGQLDMARGDDRTHGTPLARMAPLRVTVGLNWSRSAWNSRVEVAHARRQDRVPVGDTATPGYTLLNLSTGYRFKVGNSQALAFLRLDNLTDRLAYNAVSAPTVRGLSPMGGRSVKAGVRVDF